jgi:CBS domain-containing protein
MRASDVMTSSVVTTTEDTTVIDAAKLMISHRISGVPVVDRDGRLVGIVTEGDLLRRAETGTERHRAGWSEWFAPNSWLAAEYVRSHGKRVAEVMTREVVSVGELATLKEIADLMEKKRIKRVPVVNEGKIVGIVSRADVLRVLVSAGGQSANEIEDRIIRDRLIVELRKQKWADPTEGNIVVSDGVVYLWNIVGSEEERRVLRIAAENIPGVRAVEDHTISDAIRDRSFPRFEAGHPKKRKPWLPATAPKTVTMLSAKRTRCSHSTSANAAPGAALARARSQRCRNAGSSTNSVSVKSIHTSTIACIHQKPAWRKRSQRSSRASM